MFILGEAEAAVGLDELEIMEVQDRPRRRVDDKPVKADDFRTVIEQNAGVGSVRGRMHGGPFLVFGKQSLGPLDPHRRARRLIGVTLREDVDGTEQVRRHLLEVRLIDPRRDRAVFPYSPCLLRRGAGSERLGNQNRGIFVRLRPPPLVLG